MQIRILVAEVLGGWLQDTRNLSNLKSEAQRPLNATLAQVPAGLAPAVCAESSGGPL